MIIRGEGAALDNAIYEIVHMRLARLSGNRGAPLVMMLEKIAYDALPIVYRDPFDELRESILTGADASDLALLGTCCYCLRVSTERMVYGLVAVPSQHVELMRQLRECDDQWKYPMDTPELSLLAQCTLPYIFELALNEYPNNEGIPEVIRRVIADGRLVELMDPRDGAV